MIEKLEPIIVEVRGSICTTHAPSNIDMMHKINEIIDVVNRLDTDFDTLVKHPHGGEVK